MVRYPLTHVPGRIREDICSDEAPLLSRLWRRTKEHAAMPLLLIYLPIYVIAGFSKDRYKENKAASLKKRQESTPTISISKRRRPLTPPEHITANSSHFTKKNTIGSLYGAISKTPNHLDQSSCVLFQRFPYEIRQMIWIAAIGRRTLHLGTWKATYWDSSQKSPRGTHLRYVACQSREPNNPRWCVRSCYDKWYAFQPESGERQSLSYCEKPVNLPIIELLQTCSQIYRETINLVYSTNTFDTTLTTPRLLRLSILPQRYNLITSITLTLHWVSFSPNVHPPTQPSEWTTTLETLSTMPNLQHLTVRLVRHQSYARYQPDGQHLSDIALVTKPKDFVLIVPSGYDVGKELGKDHKCKIVVCDDHYNDATGMARMDRILAF